MKSEIPDQTIRHTARRALPKKRQTINKQRKQFLYRQLHLVCGAAAFCALSFSSTGANAQALFRPFSADQIHTAAGRTTTGRIYGADKAFRIESEQKGKKSIVIMRLERKVMWMLMPDQKMYMEMGSPDTAEVAALQEGAKTQRESLGSDQVGAYHCDKGRVRVTYQGREYSSIEWAAKELDGFVVKRADEKGQWSTEYHNVRLSPQDPSLFEIPSGYQKMSMGGMRVPQP